MVLINDVGELDVYVSDDSAPQAQVFAIEYDLSDAVSALPVATDESDYLTLTDVIDGGDAVQETSSFPSGNTLYGDAGDDLTLGGDNRDRMFGGDIVWGGAGDNELAGYDGDGHDSVLGGRGIDTLYGGNGNDYLNTNEDDFGAYYGGTAYDGAGRDVLDGGRSEDALFDRKGNDNRQGGRGDDHIRGWHDDDPVGEHRCGRDR